MPKKFQFSQPPHEVDVTW